MEPTQNSEVTQEAVMPSYNRSDRLLKIVMAAAATLLLIGAVIVGIMLTANEAVNQASTSSVASGKVAIGADGSFSPESIKIKKGQSVTWTNHDSRDSHQIAVTGDTATDSLKGFGTGEQLAKGESYSYVFDKAGTYQYYDVLGSSQHVGTVIVTE
jgi:plastocyanin